MKVTIEINSVADIQNAVTKATEILGLIKDLDLEIDNVGAEPEKVYPIGKTSKGADYDIDKKDIPKNIINIINYFKMIPYYLNCDWVYRFPDEKESEGCAILYHNSRGSVYYNVLNHTVYFGGFPETEEMLLNEMLVDLYREIYK